MRPSSFVFVAIVALWAAHLLPQWIRRRDTLGASRARDRFSEGLRVLARRRRPAAPTRSTSPLLPSIPVQAQPGLVEVEAVEVRPAGVQTAGARTAGARTVGARTVGARTVGVRTVGARVTGAGTPAARSAARRRRAVLAVLAALTLLTGLGALAGVVPGVVAATPLVLLLLDVAALRAVAVHEQQGRVPATRVSARAAARPAGRDQVAGADVEPVAATAHTEHDEQHDAGPGRDVVLVGEADVVDAPVDAPFAGSATAVGDTWSPVPVPPPTYTLKPVAPRAEPAPLGPSEAPVTPTVAAVPVTSSGAVATAVTGSAAVPGSGEPAPVDLDSVLERRRAVNG